MRQSALEKNLTVVFLKTERRIKRPQDKEKRNSVGSVLPWDGQGGVVPQKGGLTNTDWRPVSFGAQEEETLPC